MGKKSWETFDGQKTYYFDVSPSEVVVGEHRGTGQSDHAGSCSPEEFRAGRFQSMVLGRHGKAALLEALAIVGGTPSDAALTLKAAAPKPSPPERPVIPEGAVSSIRADLVRYDDKGKPR